MGRLCYCYSLSSGRHGRTELDDQVCVGFRWQRGLLFLLFVLHIIKENTMACDLLYYKRKGIELWERKEKKDQDAFMLGC